MQAAAAMLRACWECQGADDRDSFEAPTLDNFAAVLDVASTVGGGGGVNSEVAAEAVCIVLVQFPEVMVSVNAVPNLLCHTVLRYWMGDNMADWGLVTLLGL